MKTLWKVVFICLLITNIVFHIPPPEEHVPTANDNTLFTAPESVASPSQIPEINRNFWVADFDTNSHYEIEATLLVTGEHCLIYMQDSLIPQIGAAEALSRCESYQNEFDTRIYQTVIDLTGNPNGTLGDIDGDPRIVILINDNPTSYYSQYNEIVHAYSNLCEMFYINYHPFMILETIAHEFCHLIWFNYEFDEVHFILEGLAEYATYKCGYLEDNNNASRRTSYFLENSNDSLIYLMLPKGTMETPISSPFIWQNNLEFNFLQT